MQTDPVTLCTCDSHLEWRTNDKAVTFNIVDDARIYFEMTAWTDYLCECCPSGEGSICERCIPHATVMILPCHHRHRLHCNYIDRTIIFIHLQTE